jgi:hypothetical protein
VVAFGVALLAFGVISFKLAKIAQPRPRKISLGHPVDGRGFIGGLTWTVGGLPWRATTPLVQLRRFERGISIGPSVAGLKVFVPTWALEWDDIAAIREHGLVVEIYVRDSDHPLRFHCYSASSRQALLTDVNSHQLRP